MMEGLLSACYHVCPNYTNFQFGEATCELLPSYPSCFFGVRNLFNVVFSICINLKHPDVFKRLNFQVA